MMLSIVIPAHGQQSNIDDTLLSVLENRPENCEVLLAHPHGYEDPYDLADEIRLLPVPFRDLVSLLNAGISDADGQVIHTVIPGMVVSDGWCESALERFEEDDEIGAIAPEIIDGKSQRVRGVTYHVGSGRSLVGKRAQTVLGPTLASGFYLRRAMQFMHGFDARFEAWADVELSLRMLSAQYRCVTTRDVPLHTRSSIQKLWTNHQVIPSSYRVGQIRGNLFQRAKAFGFANSQISAFLTEPLRHGIGPGIVTGTWGRLVCPDLSPMGKLPADNASPHAHRRAA